MLPDSTTRSQSLVRAAAIFAHTGNQQCKHAEDANTNQDAEAEQMTIGSGEEAGLDKIVEALQRLLVEMPGCQTVVCLETMAGQGTNLGYKFEHLAYILDKCDRPDRLGVCLDTCHIFAAGYDFRTPAGYEATMAEFDRTVGLDQIKFFHFNDSKFGLGEQKDRHEHIGRGEIGRDGFANFVNDPRWAAHAAHLETPKTEEDDNGAEIEMDPINLAVLKELRK